MGDQKYSPFFNGCEAQQTNRSQAQKNNHFAAFAMESQQAT